MAERKQVQQYVLEPTTGKAIPVIRGQVLRIRQIGKGQCLDFNAFNLHDYKEYFHCGRTRHMHGLNPTKGDHLWSAPPRDRICSPFWRIRSALTTSITRAAAHSCSSISSASTEHPAHSNCHDILAESHSRMGPDAGRRARQFQRLHAHGRAGRQTLHRPYGGV